MACSVSEMRLSCWLSSTAMREEPPPPTVSVVADFSTAFTQPYFEEVVAATERVLRLNAW